MTPSQREGVPTTRGGTTALSIRPLLDLCFEERRMTDAARAELGRPGTLRVGIHLGNILLVTGPSASGEPQGVAPDMAAAIAERPGVAAPYVPFAPPGAAAHPLPQARQRRPVGQ